MKHIPCRDCNNSFQCSISVGPWGKQQPVNNLAIWQGHIPFLQAQGSAWRQRKLNFRRWRSSQLGSQPFFPRATGRNQEVRFIPGHQGIPRNPSTALLLTAAVVLAWLFCFPVPSPLLTAHLRAHSGQIKPARLSGLSAGHRKAITSGIHLCGQAAQGHILVFICQQGSNPPLILLLCMEKVWKVYFVVICCTDLSCGLLQTHSSGHKC